MCDCDSNYCITINHIDRKARKDHKCCECQRTILKGETYESVSGLWRESGFDTFKTCGHCVAAREVCKQLDPGSCVCFMGLVEHIWDNRSDIAYGVHRRKLQGSIRSWLDVFRLYRDIDHGWKYRRGPHKGTLKAVPS